MIVRGDPFNLADPFCLLHSFNKRMTDNYLPLSLGNGPLASLHSAANHERCTYIELPHEQDCHCVAEPTPISSAALVQQFLQSLTATVRPCARCLQQQAHRVPKTWPFPRFLLHRWGGRAVSFKNVSSRLACSCVARSSSIDPMATTVPSLMITACEHSLVT